MELQTPVTLPAGLPFISHADRLMLLGSCFATEIGTRLTEAKFNCDVNPFGVLYNPLSLSTALRRIVTGQPYGADELYQHNGLWHSPMHHGDFSAPDVTEALERINHRLTRAHHSLPQLTRLLLTFGTVWVYEDKESGRVVGNCHKLPERLFRRRLLTVDEVVSDYVSLLSGLLAVCPQLKVLITISPIRHLRDGLHQNQLSKATLLLATERVCSLFPDRVSYFPAYEILLDELRDYRFYAPDMVHPSEVAVSYVWERFSQACFSAETRQLVATCQQLARDLSHRPLRPDSEVYKRFLGQIMLKIDQLTEKYPYLGFQNEKELCNTRLNK